MSDPNDWFHKPEVIEGYGVQYSPVRWLAYKRGAQTNKLGRWQQMTEYGGWMNMDSPPFVVIPARPDITTPLTAALAIPEIAAMREALERIAAVRDEPALFYLSPSSLTGRVLLDGIKDAREALAALEKDAT